MLLDDTTEYDLVWNKVYQIFQFTPSVNWNVKPFEINEKYAIYKIDEMTEKQLDMLKIVMGKIFSDITEDGSKMYALDWHHRAFLSRRRLFFFYRKRI